MTEVVLRPWTVSDLRILVEQNTEEMTRYLGGPEDGATLASRNERYVNGWADGESWIFRLDVPGVGDSVGSVGYWPTEWEGMPVYEMGWAVAKRAQGRGIATLAVRQCLGYAVEHGTLELMTAFPLIENVASNSICRRVGFELLGEADFPGRRVPTVRVNAWSYRLRPISSS